MPASVPRPAWRIAGAKAASVAASPTVFTSSTRLSLAMSSMSSPLVPVETPALAMTSFGAHRVAALHCHCRRAVDLVGDGLLRRAARLALHAEGLQRVEELLRVDALLLQPFGERLRAGGVQPIAMDGVEERPVQLVEHA